MPSWATPGYTRATGYLVTAANWNEIAQDLAFLASETTGKLFLGVTGSAPVYKAVPPMTSLTANGSKGIWQRGNGPWTATGGGADTFWTADRYVIYASGTDTLVATRETDPSLVDMSATAGYSSNALKIVYTPSGGGLTSVVKQVLTIGYELPVCPTVLSYRVRVRCTTAGAVRAYVADRTGGQQASSAYNTGGTNWETLSAVNMTVTSTAIDIECGLEFPATGCTVYIGWETLVPAPAAVDYNPVQYAADLLACERYYEKQGLASKAIYYSTYASGAFEISSSVHWHTFKNIVPTTTVVGSWTTVNPSATNPTIGGTSQTGCSLVFTATGAGMCSYQTVNSGTYVLAKTTAN